VFIEEVPLPNVFVKEAPVPIVDAPFEVRVVNAPVPGVEAPTVVPLMLPPVAVSVPAVIEFEAPDKVRVFEYVPESPADNKTPEAFNIGVPPTFKMFPKVPVVVMALVTVPAVWVKFSKLVTVPAPVCWIKVLLVKVPAGLLVVWVATVKAEDVAAIVSLVVAG
jgi:hypothetical protein